MIHKTSNEQPQRLLPIHDTPLPFELDTPVYDAVRFKYVEEDNSFEVFLKILDQKAYKKGIHQYKTKRLFLPDHPTEPADHYHRPSALLYIGPSGIGRLTSGMRKFQGMPEGARRCYQCEYDEYVWKRVEEGSLPKSNAYFYNWAVWDAYREYRQNEESTEQFIQQIEQNRP
jgi:hypothetical protein